MLHTADLAFALCLPLADPRAQEFLMEQMEEFFFGEGGQ